MKRLILFLMMVLLLSGCNTVISDNTKTTTATDYVTSFSEEEVDASYQINGSTYITLSNEDVKITRAGTYILEGTLNGSVIVEVSKSDDVQIVLNNVTINSGNFAGIYIVEGDEITITLADGSVNTISDSGEYTQIDDNNVDALIYSKADLLVNGSGELNLNSDYNHGLVSKDDLVIASGTYNIDVAGQGIRGKDCVRINDGVFNITSGKDAIKSDNDEDAYRGYVYIAGGTFNINSDADGIYGLNLVTIDGGTFVINTNKSSSATSYKGIKSAVSIVINDGTFEINAYDDAIHCDKDIVINGGDITINSSDDGIHADETVTINNGNISISAYEGIESTYITLNDGSVSIYATDDGINAGQKVSTYTATFEMNGGYLSVSMGQGDTDAVDANGYIYINGGTVEITGQSAFDYDIGAQHNGGTIIVNGSEITEITSSMGGGMQGGGMQGGFGGHNFGN